jgi:hypothetical protein
MHHNINEVGKLRLVATDFSLQVHVKHINFVFATSHSYVILSLNQSIDPGFKYHPRGYIKSLLIHGWSIIALHWNNLSSQRIIWLELAWFYKFEISTLIFFCLDLSQRNRYRIAWACKKDIRVWRKAKKDSQVQRETESWVMRAESMCFWWWNLEGSRGEFVASTLLVREFQDCNHPKAQCTALMLLRCCCCCST